LLYFADVRIDETIRLASHNPWKGRNSMQVPYPETTLLAAAGAPEEHTQIGHTLYKGATVVAILLLLMSFCF
jgi:hypothetical protein